VTQENTRKHEKNDLRCSAATSTQAPSKRPNRTPEHVAWNTWSKC